MKKRKLRYVMNNIAIAIFTFLSHHVLVVFGNEFTDHTPLLL